MSSAKKCDRCGKLFEGRYDTNIKITTYDNEFSCGFNDNLDLCSDCVESFKHWWANETVIHITKKETDDETDRKTT